MYTPPSHGSQRHRKLAKLPQFVLIALALTWSGYFYSEEPQSLPGHIQQCDNIGSYEISYSHGFLGSDGSNSLSLNLYACMVIPEGDGPVGPVYLVHPSRGPLVSTASGACAEELEGVPVMYSIHEMIDFYFELDQVSERLQKVATLASRKITFGKNVPYYMDIDNKVFGCEEIPGYRNEQEPRSP